MFKKNKYLVILTPSSMSLTLSVLASIGLMTLVSLTYLSGQGALYNYLLGPGSSADLISSSQTTFAALDKTVLGNSALNKVLYFAFWMMVGLVVYIILYSLLKGGNEAAEELNETNYANINKNRILHDFAIKATVRVTAVIAWIVFNIILAKVLLPYASLEAKKASAKYLSSHGLLHGFLGFLILLVSFHIEVVLLRFIFLRVRLVSRQEYGV